MKNKKEECPACSKEFGLDEMDYDQEKKVLVCPYCGTVIIENYREE